MSEAESISKPESKVLTRVLACIGLCCILISLITSAMSLAHMKKAGLAEGVETEIQTESVELASPSKT